MYISRIVIRNFRNFELLDSVISPGVTCIVGENNTGKSNLIEAIRLTVDASLSSVRRELLAEDFPSGQDISTPKHVLVSIEFKGFTEKPNEQAMLFGFNIDDKTARITYRFRPRREIREAIKDFTHPGTGLTIEDYRWELSGGGVGIDPATVTWDQDFGQWVRFEELQQSYLVVFMEPLRDVEQRLKQSRSSPLAKLLTSSDVPKAEQDALVKILEDANNDIADSKTIEKIGTDLTEAFKAAAGQVFKMDVRLGMTSPNFQDVSRGLSVLLSNNAVTDATPARNGLGSNNVLYISMLLKYFQRRIAEAKTAGQLLIIEELEAHLHPQLQRVLFNALNKETFQTFLTSHSTHITSGAPLSSVLVLSNDGTPVTASCNPFLKLKAPHVADLERYLDATRGALFFARKIMFVEGPTELFMIPKLVESVLGINLDEEGISVIPIYGVHFDTYAAMFGPEAIQKKCAIVADGDLTPDDADLADPDDEELAVHKPELAKLINPFVNVFTCATTFERELTSHGTLRMLAQAAEEAGAKKTSAYLLDVKSKLDDAELVGLPPAEIKGLLDTASEKVLTLAKRVGKARFAQILSKHTALASSIPPYISQAVDWLRK
jgi:putative ATP-dependent endonuclease of OLD family